MSLSRRSSRLCSILLIAAFAWMTGCDAAGPDGSAATDPDPAAPITAVSDGGLYHVEVWPDIPPARLGHLHAWRVRVQRVDGQPTTLSRLAFTASMPQHGHGLTTAPLATRGFDDGTFLVDGVLFHMSGEWMLRIEFVGSEGPDAVEFSINVLP